jgi:hypothetical protein
MLRAELSFVVTNLGIRCSNIPLELETLVQVPLDAAVEACVGVSCIDVRISQ